MSGKDGGGLCGYVKDDGDPCELPAGWGTGHVGEGRCDHHPGRGAPEGNNNAVGNSGGCPPDNNGNAETHSLKSDPGTYYKRQSPDEQDRIDGWAESWSRRGGYDGLGFDKLFQTHAIKLHQIETADEAISDDGVIITRIVDRTESGEPITKDEEHSAFLLQSRALKDISRFLKDFGCLNDPDTKQAAAQQDLADAWRDALEEVE